MVSVVLGCCLVVSFAGLSLTCAGFFAAGFLAAGFLAAGFFAAGFFVVLFFAAVDVWGLCVDCPLWLLIVGWACD